MTPKLDEEQSPVNQPKSASASARSTKPVASYEAGAAIAPGLAKTMETEALRQALIENGMEILPGGECRFYPFTGTGVPDMSQTTLVTDGVEDALRQCDHAVKGALEKQKAYGALLGKLSRLRISLETSMEGTVTQDDADHTLLAYEADIAPALPTRIPGSEYMRKLIGCLQDIRLSLGAAEFGKAVALIELVQPMVELTVAVPKMQADGWASRKQLIKDICSSFSQAGEPT